MIFPQDEDGVVRDGLAVDDELLYPVTLLEYKARLLRPQARTQSVYREVKPEVEAEITVSTDGGAGDGRHQRGPGD